MTGFLQVLSILSTQNNWPSLASIGQFFYILLLVVVVALMAFYATRLLAASKTMRRGRHNLSVIESIGVGAQSMVQIVRAGDKYFVIGVTKERITFLTELDASSVKSIEDQSADNEKPFEKLLNRFMTKEKKNGLDD